jgi:hypothetical protein
MKSDKQPSFYFSAYPLKAIHSSSSPADQSPYLKAVLNGKTRSFSRVRVLPMLNPYKAVAPVKPIKTEPARPEDAGMNESGWYNNYE